MQISKNKADLFFYWQKQNESHHKEIVEDPC